MREQSYNLIVPTKVGNRRAPETGGHGTHWREGGSKRTTSSITSTNKSSWGLDKGAPLRWGALSVFRHSEDKSLPQEHTWKLIRSSHSSSHKCHFREPLPWISSKASGSQRSVFHLSSL
jgi:hypothetical protein